VKREPKKSYEWGAKNGLVSILYMILRATKILPRFKFASLGYDFVRLNLDNLLSQIEATNGALANDKGGATFTVDFCQGSPGVLPLIFEAVDYFPDWTARLLHAAEMIGNFIWTNGLVLRSNCLCHGIAGNGILMHCLSRMYTKLKNREPDERKKALYQGLIDTWRVRTFMFAKALSEPAVKKG
jgi:hypothetical protein